MTARKQIQETIIFCRRKHHFEKYLHLAVAEIVAQQQSHWSHLKYWSLTGKLVIVIKIDFVDFLLSFFFYLDFSLSLLAGSAREQSIICRRWTLRCLIFRHRRRPWTWLVAPPT